jgi:hypothetical protein
MEAQSAAALPSCASILWGTGGPANKRYVWPTLGACDGWHKMTLLVFRKFRQLPPPWSIEEQPAQFFVVATPKHLLTLDVAAAGIALLTSRSQMPDRTFPPPWSSEEHSAYYVVRESNGQGWRISTTRTSPADDRLPSC